MCIQHYCNNYKCYLWVKSSPPPQCHHRSGSRIRFHSYLFGSSISCGEVCKTWDHNRKSLSENGDSSFLSFAFLHHPCGKQWNPNAPRLPITLESLFTCYRAGIKKLQLQNLCFYEISFTGDHVCRRLACSLCLYAFFLTVPEVEGKIRKCGSRYFPMEQK